VSVRERRREHARGGSIDEDFVHASHAASGGTAIRKRTTQRRRGHLQPHRHHGHRATKASNTGANDWFAVCLALSYDGNTPRRRAERGQRRTGVGGRQDDESAVEPIAHLFTRTGTMWAQQAWQGSNTEPHDEFGSRRRWSRERGRWWSQRAAKQQRAGRQRQSGRQLGG
jgi:hypothetical protein